MPSPLQPPTILPPLHETPSPSTRISTIIFLHGLGDDGHGTGYGLAQQFQRYNKLPYTKWILPTAALDPAVGQRCWYKPPSNLHEDDNENNKENEDDEEGILKTVEYIDSLVAAEVQGQGTDPGRIVVGGFSQGCAVSMIWGLKSPWKDKIAGVFGLSGYFPNIKSVVMPGEGQAAGGGGGGADSAPLSSPRWFFAHGLADRLISTKLFAEGQKRLQEYVGRENIEGHVYEQLGHDIGAGELRDFWLWLKMVLQE